MDVDLILIGPAGHKCYARMGVTKHNLVNDYVRHAMMVKGTLCIHDGCGEPISHHQQGWTCSLHDPFCKPKAPKG